MLTIQVFFVSCSLINMTDRQQVYEATVTLRANAQIQYTDTHGFSFSIIYVPKLTVFARTLSILLTEFCLYSTVSKK